VADINVERKRRSLLPWIIGLLLLAVLGYFLAKAYFDFGEAEVTEVEVDTATP
jgi:hypothetical protein